MVRYFTPYSENVLLSSEHALNLFYVNIRHSIETSLSDTPR